MPCRPGAPQKPSSWTSFLPELSLYQRGIHVNRRQIRQALGKPAAIISADFFTVANGGEEVPGGSHFRTQKLSGGFFGESFETVESGEKVKTFKGPELFLKGGQTKKQAGGRGTSRYSIGIKS